MAELKKHGANLSIKNMIIHQVIKDAGVKESKMNPAPAPLNSGEKEQVFLGKLHKSYHKKSNPIYGIFAGKDTRFSDELTKYRLKSESDFYGFSTAVLDLYRKTLDNTTTASGGFMILCEYTNMTTSSDLLLLLMLNNKEGYVVNEADLTLQDIKNLDLSKVDLACLIDLTEWETYTAGGETDRVTYMSFTKGNKIVSNYFLNFIDCDNKNTHHESTARLIAALEAFAFNLKLTSDDKIQRREKVYNYCNQQSRGEVLLDTISAIFYPEDPTLFRDFASNEGYKVSSVISIDNVQMRELKYVKYKSDEFTIEFDSELVVQKKISLDNKGRLIIKDLPGSLRSKILTLQDAE